MNKVAIIYDFDQTLCTKNMQEYSLLQLLNLKANDFWQEVVDLAKTSNMDPILAYMYLLVKYAKKQNIRLTKDKLLSFGKDIEFFPGVETYFDRINGYGREKDIEVQHFIISSGTSELIQGCSISKYFKKIYSCQFHYDENGDIDWPALAINYTGKTQFLYRINKGCLEVYDNSTINAKVSIKDIDFDHMVYIADGYSDVPCMTLVKNYGGYAIAVGEEENKNRQQLLLDGRVNYVAKPDYQEKSELDLIIHSIIDKIAIEDKLKQYR